MAKDNIRKIKVLKLLEHLRQNTDEQHPLSARQIAADLAAMGVPFDPRTISQDIVVLNELGYEIMSTMVGHEKRYYIEDRSFSVPELKILIDAVQAASFITDKKTAELIDKIAELGGSHKADILKSNMVCFNVESPSCFSSSKVAMFRTCWPLIFTAPVRLTGIFSYILPSSQAS